MGNPGRAGSPHDASYEFNFGWTQKQTAHSDVQAKNTKSLKLTVDYFDVHDDAGPLTTNPERGR